MSDLANGGASLPRMYQKRKSTLLTESAGFHSMQRPSVIGLKHNGFTSASNLALNSRPTALDEVRRKATTPTILHQSMSVAPIPEKKRPKSVTIVEMQNVEHEQEK